MTLEYWNTLANQTLVVSSLLSGFSVTVVASLLVSEQKGPLNNSILKAATLTAGCFLISLFAMLQISMMTTPGSYLQNVSTDDFFIPRVIGVLAFMLGLFSLSVMISLSGWTKSRQTGIFTTIVGVTSLLLILTTMIHIGS